MFRPTEATVGRKEMTHFPNQNMDDPKSAEFLRESELARRWKTSQRTLQRWRAQDAGPPFVRLGGAIRYRLTDIENYENCMVQNADGDRSGDGA